MNKKESCVMIFVTPQSSCARLIEAGSKIAAKEHKRAVIVSVVKENNQENINALNDLYECVEKNHVDMNLYFNDDPYITSAVAAKRFNASVIITGFPGERGSGFIFSVHELLPDIPIIMIDYDNTEYKILPFKKSDVEKAKSSVNLE
jgi:hypothetical protein